MTTLPLTLDAHYDEAWEKATGGSDLLRSRRAQLILMWLSCSLHLLTTRALREGLAHPGYHSQEGDITDEEIVSSCAGFLTSFQDSTPCPYRNHVRVNGKDIVLTRPPMSNAFAEVWRTWLGGTKAAPEEFFDDDLTLIYTHPSVYFYLLERRQIPFPKSSGTIASACLLALTPNEVLCALPHISAFLLE